MIIQSHRTFYSDFIHHHHILEESECETESKLYSESESESEVSSKSQNCGPSDKWAPGLGDPLTSDLILKMSIIASQRIIFRLFAPWYG